MRGKAACHCQDGNLQTDALPKMLIPLGYTLKVVLFSKPKKEIDRKI